MKGSLESMSQLIFPNCALDKCLHAKGRVSEPLSILGIYMIYDVSLYLSETFCLSRRGCYLCRFSCSTGPMCCLELAAERAHQKRSWGAQYNKHKGLIVCATSEWMLHQILNIPMWITNGIYLANVKSGFQQNRFMTYICESFRSISWEGVYELNFYNRRHVTIHISPLRDKPR